MEHAPPPQNLLLRHVVVLMRHGDRSPIASMLGNVTVDQDYWLRQLPAEDEGE
eukprot:CAMPEP_0119329370 /NCGR_PEP_ID=MMETSP1333-20130426/75666_1 /TAXON_ID=418940 /ORGANISM="Scyphosphaera apsteinii, Strain RCC1455" /LENGTH=52 /DNA_ID=CAMNT_0007338473 /DNA_START=75 /DNA_END=230 /DNA_ORIENTATION=+